MCSKLTSMANLEENVQVLLGGPNDGWPAETRILERKDYQKPGVLITFSH